MLIPFPTEFPQEALGTLLEAWRGNLPGTSLAVNCAWNMAGYVAGQTVGKPVMAAPPDDGPLTDAKVYKAFAEAAQCCENRGPGLQAITIPPDVLAILKQVVMLLLQRWFGLTTAATTTTATAGPGAGWEAMPSTSEGG